MKLIDVKDLCVFARQTVSVGGIKTYAHFNVLEAKQICVFCQLQTQNYTHTTWDLADSLNENKTSFWIAV